MASNISFNGVTYSIPADGDSGWGADLTAYLIAISTGVLARAGGTFTLTADVDFGSNFGLKSPYYTSKATNPSATGVLRLGNTQSVGWRNFANSADVLLTVNASDVLQFNGASFIYSGLGSIVNADINAAAAIEYSKLNLATSILNSDINASAAIALTKLAATTVSRALVSNASGFVSAATTTDVEIGYVNGVTSAIQTQMNLKAPLASPTFTGTVTVPATITGPSAVVITLPTASDTLVGRATTDTLTNKSISGSTNTITNVSLTTGVTGTLPIGNGGTGQTTKALAFDALSPMTTLGDIIHGGASGTGTRLAAGSSNQYLKSNGASAPSWATFTAPVITLYITGTGTHALTAGVKYVIIRAIGGGGGGGGSGTASNNFGTAGSTTTVGATTISCTGGGGGGQSGNSTGGVPTTYAGTNIFVLNGADGAGAVYSNSSNAQLAGGIGGGTTFASGGAGGSYGGAGRAPVAGSGAGGGGGGGAGSSITVFYSGAGGAGGGSAQIIVSSGIPGSYAYTVGAGGAGGGAGTSGSAGGAGAAGQVYFEEHFQ